MHVKFCGRRDRVPAIRVTGAPLFIFRRKFPRCLIYEGRAATAREDARPPSSQDRGQKSVNSYTQGSQRISRNQSTTYQRHGAHVGR